VFNNLAPVHSYGFLSKGILLYYDKWLDTLLLATKERKTIIYQNSRLNFHKNSFSMWTFVNVPKQALKHIFKSTFKFWHIKITVAQM
jgi:hypothetical protein